MTPCLFYPIKICPASFSIISTTNPQVPPMERVQLGLTTFSSNTLPLSEGSVSLHQLRQLLDTTTTGPGQGWQPPPQALRLLPSDLSLPNPPSSSLPSVIPHQAPHTWILPSPTSLPHHGNHNPGGPAGIPKTSSRTRVSLVPP